MRIPGQVLRLSVPVVVVIGGFLFARSRLVPPTFGDIGHYRAAALGEIAALPIHYAGADSCAVADCHEDVMETKMAGYHRGVSCEVCHGPAADHVKDPENVKVKKPKSRTFCPVCHTYLLARPTGFPQIIPENHNMPKSCIKCHDPHDPVPSEAPSECSACHRTIVSLKTVSKHSDLKCTTCHQTPTAHFLEPRQEPPLEARGPRLLRQVPRGGHEASQRARGRSEAQHGDALPEVELLAVSLPPPARGPLT